MLSESEIIDKLNQAKIYRGIPIIYPFTVSGGEGKTTILTDWIRRDIELSPFIISENHMTLDEVESKLPTTELNHWRGHSALCRVKQLRGLPANIACQICSQLNLKEHRKCDYKNQFNHRKRITLAPIEYSATKYPYRIKINVIWIEESPFKCKELTPPPQIILDLQEDVLGFKPDYVRCYLLEISLENQLIDKLTSNYDRRSALELARETLAYPPTQIGEYLYYSHRSENKIKFPYLHNIFDLACRKQCNIVVTDATYSNAMFMLYLASYRSEESRVTPVSQSYIKKDSEPYTESVIYRIGRGWFPRQTLNNHEVISGVAEGIARIAYHHRLKKVPIITFEGFEDHLKSLIELELKRKGLKVEVESMHFGNLRTLNDFADYGFGFVVGTYNVGKDIIKQETESLFLPTNFESVKDYEGGYRFMDKDLEEYRKWYEESEQYQGIHRFRPLRKPTIVFVWGKVPASISNEITTLELFDAATYVMKSSGKHKGKPRMAIDEGIEIAKHYIEDYGADYIPISEVREYIKSKGLSHMNANKVIRELKKSYAVYTKLPSGTGRPKEYFL